MMSIEKQRLISLIEFAKHASRLRSKPVSSINQHGLFSLYEHDAQGLPGIHYNTTGPDSEDEIWFIIDRLREKKSPEILNPMLKPWVEMSNNPNEEPKLLLEIPGSKLPDGASQTHSTPGKTPTGTVDPYKTIFLADYPKYPEVKTLFNAYLQNNWKPWATEEKPRRKTIQIYTRLFTLKQQLEGGIIENQIEFLCGVGMGIWMFNGYNVRYPLISRLVEMTLNTDTAQIEIRPRDMDARIELDFYSSTDNPGVPRIENAAKEFFSAATKTFSPFDRSSFEPLLLSARVHLDDKGIYWPNEVKPEDRSLPIADNKLKITDTWVLFARPRTKNMYINDLEKLQKAAEETDHTQYPPAVSAIVTDPATENTVIDLPVFRGVSATYGYNGERSDSSGKKPQDLYFPKPFNEEQVRIIQMLEVSKGVFVQGPPGTGKTHTIANVICHYLALGKRVLVTSMKDPALAVLKDQLPDEIKPLAISLLSSEYDGLKQFEYAINKIASEIQGFDRTSTSRQIHQLEEEIDELHSRIALIYRKINEWAVKNLTKITLDDVELEAHEAARKIVDNLGQFEWIPDKLDIGNEFTPQLSNDDIIKLRESRRILGQDINYLDCSLPQLNEFSDSKDLLIAHQDLSQYIRLKKDIDSGNIPNLADSSQETYDRTVLALSHISSLQDLYSVISKANKLWTDSLKNQLREKDDSLFNILESLSVDINSLNDKRRIYIERPVNIPMGSETNSEFTKAVANLSAGNSPFGMMGLFGKTAIKKMLSEVKVGIKNPEGTADWKHINEYISLQLSFRDFVLRWNTLAAELGIDVVSLEKPEEAIKTFDLYQTLKSVVQLETDLCIAASCILPAWTKSREMADDSSILDELKRILSHHIAKNRLANVWVNKERFQNILNAHSGQVMQDIRKFLANKFGNPEVSDTDMQTSWSSIMAELSRIHGLSSYLATVRNVCALIEASGAPQYAKTLKQPLNGTIDTLLPDKWRESWNLKRIATYLDSINAHDELKRLAHSRNMHENKLSKAYRDIVVKRTWLKLESKASPSIRSALQAYLIAIQRIGKGTGKRAVRYRQDARMAAAQANPAVPCWIMPHYRVSESLPSELGCFDLVVIDEASQSDMDALPALLRAQKVLIVGDDKQVSPEGIGLEEEKVRNLMSRFLGNHVETYRAQMSPERSIYDLFKVIFAHSGVMLKEHFRSVGPIIEYSKREFYNHELMPLRMPKLSESLDPPLVDIIVDDGYRKGDLNIPEINFIVEEIRSIVEDPQMTGRSIGVVSLLGDKQAIEVWDRLWGAIGQEKIERHKITCGDARTFQGKERDIMFLTMVIAPNDTGIALSRDTFAQRFNVAASRARDRMYLVRSVELEHLSNADKLRRSLIMHFDTPFMQDEERVEDLRKLCESPFEEAMYDELTRRGYYVTPQVRVGKYRIDLVVEGNNDNRLAVECDGDKYHGIDKWAEDMARQRVLERAGWTFWRCFASAFIQHKDEVLDDLIKTLADNGIEPIGVEGAPRSVHTEHRHVTSFKMDEKMEDEPETSPDIPSETSFLQEDTPKKSKRTFKGKTGSLFETIDRIFPENLNIEEKEVPSIKTPKMTDLCVEPGDRVTYFDILKADEKITVRIVGRPTNLIVGDLNENTPLARILLGLEVGDEGYLIVPGNNKKILRILEIDRPGIGKSVYQEI
jgi:superfamily I DNA and/or RNA helicase